MKTNEGHSVDHLNNKENRSERDVESDRRRTPTSSSNGNNYNSSSSNNRSRDNDYDTDYSGNSNNDNDEGTEGRSSSPPDDDSISSNDSDVLIMRAPTFDWSQLPSITDAVHALRTPNTPRGSDQNDPHLYSHSPRSLIEAPESEKTHENEENKAIKKDFFKHEIVRLFLVFFDIVLAFILSGGQTVLLELEEFFLLVKYKLQKKKKKRVKRIENVLR